MVFNVTMEIVYPTSRGAIPSVTATTEVTKQDAHKVFLSLFSSACIIYIYIINTYTQTCIQTDQTRPDRQKDKYRKESK